MSEIHSLVVVGSSATGKTTLIEGLRAGAYTERVVVPRRYYTRAVRPDDGLDQLGRLSPEQFQQRVSAGRIYPHWTRKFEPQRTERYGFEAIDRRDRRLKIYAANNAFMRNSNASVSATLTQALVVGVSADHQVREARLNRKAMPDIERQLRLADDGADIPGMPNIHAIIDTTYLAPDEGEAILRRIVDQILDEIVGSESVAPAGEVAAWITEHPLA